jgi:hypothetical protein
VTDEAEETATIVRIVIGTETATTIVTAIVIEAMGDAVAAVRGAIVTMRGTAIAIGTARVGVGAPITPIDDAPQA